MDPFFPFEEAVDVWARTFAALGIQYKGATMRLDLCDRPGKYSNGFCHWPQPAWRKVSPTSHCDLVASCLDFCAVAVCHVSTRLFANPYSQMLSHCYFHLPYCSDCRFEQQPIQMHCIAEQRVAVHKFGPRKVCCVPDLCLPFRLDDAVLLLQMCTQSFTVGLSGM